MERFAIPESPERFRFSRFRDWSAFALTTLAMLGALAATSAEYGYATDEATYRWVAAEMRRWVAEFPVVGAAESLSPAGIARRWHFLEPPGAQTGYGHSNFNLPGSVYVLNIGWLLGRSWLDDLSALRLGNMLLFSITGATAAITLAKERGGLAGLAAAFAWVSSPRVFGHAHLAATETPLLCFWILSLLALTAATRPESAHRFGAALRFGCVLGVALATKLTAWLILPPILLWLLLVRPPGTTYVLAAGALVSPLVLLAATPNLWGDPVWGLLHYLREAASNPWRIPIYYFGRCYSDEIPRESGLVLFLLTVPIGFLVFALYGLALGLRDRIAGLFAINLVALLAFRCAGLIPAHDGVRQFLPALGLAAVLAALSFSSLFTSVHIRAQKYENWRSAFLGRVTAAGLLSGFLLEPALEVWTYRGHGLSYYNRLIGGLPGADVRRLEVSYWYEAMTDTEWRRLLAPLPAGARVFLRPDHPGVPELKAWGVWPAHVKLAAEPENADYYLLYARKASYWTVDPATGRLVETDLARQEAFGRAIREVRFLGVRMAALLPTP